MKLNEITDSLEETRRLWLSKNTNLRYQDFKISDDGVISVPNSSFLMMIEKDFEEIPYPFGYVEGKIRIENCEEMLSLKNFPTEITEGVTIDNCAKISDLRGAPKHVGDLILEKLDALESLKGLENTRVDNIFEIAYCYYLESLKYCPHNIGGLHTVRCGFTDLTGLPSNFNPKAEIAVIDSIKFKSLKGCPNEIGSLHLDDCKYIESFEGGPSIINGDVYISKCNIKSFDHLPKEINGTLNMSVNGAKDILKILNIKKLISVSLNAPLDVVKILNKHVKTRDMIECQEELIEAGFKEWARLK